MRTRGNADQFHRRTAAADGTNCPGRRCRIAAHVSRCQPIRSVDARAFVSVPAWPPRADTATGPPRLPAAGRIALQAFLEKQWEPNRVHRVNGSSPRGHRGGCHGSRHSVLAVRGSYPDHDPAWAAVALSMSEVAGGRSAARSIAIHKNVFAPRPGIALPRLVSPQNLASIRGPPPRGCRCASMPVATPLFDVDRDNQDGTHRSACRHVAADGHG